MCAFFRLPRHHYETAGIAEGPCVAFYLIALMVMDKIPSPCFPGLPRADPSELSFIQPIGGLSHAIGITAFVLFNLDLVPMEKISALSLLHFVRTILSIIPILKMKLF